jgi:hypothetical protein
VEIKESANRIVSNSICIHPARHTGGIFFFNRHKINSENSGTVEYLSSLLIVSRQRATLMDNNRNEAYDMREIGELLGILTAWLFAFAILNYVVKFVNRKWVMKLPKESKFKQNYMPVMKFFVKNHRFFGFGAAVVMVAHVVVQILFAWVSVTGLITAALAVVTVILGGIMFKAKKRTPAMLWAHRGAVIALILSFIIHVVTKI